MEKKNETEKIHFFRQKTHNLINSKTSRVSVISYRIYIEYTFIICKLM